MPSQNSISDKTIGFLGEDLFVEGTIHSQKKIVVSGTIDGSVLGDREIVVSETGHVNGTVEGKVVLIAGKVDGDLLVQERLEVNSTANVKGEVRVPSGQLLIQEGAQLEAQCNILYENHSGNQS
ncbi:MAG: polymer-forming cytoskeletal protein [SAR324 cluster bacterium]|jgi:cytoskeletal protein CcmA (bactofilin family)|uniref:Polymer-forming cytoskeletal protein n=1 Tax=marine metagenome TaxID=408172 RepID=A0A381RBV0_9ZZZZ|nr:polymer-forming cytoskeletal protein [SAR324 cluster bacterium]MCS5546262.1 polymer-forming cytoskeletal protein [SAR324 cluster bacterium]|tara:strand:+ start:508 stop:879 length:372 start_codon:yes stop_codon:yes gene_type:complete